MQNPHRPRLFAPQNVPFPYLVNEHRKRIRRQVRLHGAIALSPTSGPGQWRQPQDPAECLGVLCVDYAGTVAKAVAI